MDDLRDGKRPVFVQKCGNTVVRIHSSLPFMSTEERLRWYKDNEHLPEVQTIKQVLLEIVCDVERKSVG